MEFHKSTTGARRAAGALIMLLLILGISKLPAGVGTHGRTGETSNSKIVYRPDLSLFEIDPNGATAQAVRDLMVTKINTVPTQFSASADTSDPNTASVRIVRADGSELSQLAVCENAVGYTAAGVRIDTGKRIAVLSKPASVAGDGTYRLRLSMWDTADYDASFPTAGLTPATLLAAVTSSLTTAGFAVTDLGNNCGEFGAGLPTAGCISISKGGDMVVSTLVDSTDTGVSEVCVAMSPGGTGIPTLSQYGMFALVVLMTGAAIFMMRRRRGLST